jgi:hypothetical protein
VSRSVWISFWPLVSNTRASRSFMKIMVNVVFSVNLISIISVSFPKQ